MIKKILASAVALPIALLGWTATFAQDEEDKAPHVAPVDTFTCNYNEGKGPADLEEVIGGWNAYMDKQGANDYGAITLTPRYYGEDTFDIGWLGYWTSQEAMGAGMDSYRTSGAKTAKAFSEVLTCQSHSHWATIQAKAPNEGERDTGVLMFSDCSLTNDDGWDEFFTSLKQASAYMTEQNYGNGMWLMWPVFGGGGESTFDFKAITHYDNYTDFGKAYQHRANGGGRQALREIYGGQLECDTTRVYDTKTVRRPAPPAED